MVLSIQYYSQYKFNVEEVEMEDQVFSVFYPKRQNVYDLIKEAARIFYYGKSGWTQTWPLTFIIKNKKNQHIARADVYICSSLPEFDIIIKDS